MILIRFATRDARASLRPWWMPW